MLSASGKKWDFFICHASEDKEEIARPLAELLRKNALRVWYDEFSLTLGDSLRRSIDRGLKLSKYGLVILSPSFFEKEWPQKELDGLAAREIDGTKVILPVWHKVTREIVIRYSPTLADKMSVSTEHGIDRVMAAIMRAFQEADDSPTGDISERNKGGFFHLQIKLNKVDSLSTGALSLDLALGTLGWPRGYIAEIFSPPSSGKTSLVLSAAKEAQAIENPVLYIDSDFGLIDDSITKSGASLNDFIHIRPDDLEQVFDAVITFLDNCSNCLIIIDSISNVLPRRYYESKTPEFMEHDEKHRDLISYFLQRIQPSLYKTGSVLLITNRLVEKVGFFLGNPETTPWATKPIADAASIRLDMRRLTAIKDRDDVIGSFIKTKTIKNRFSPPFREASFCICYNSGIDKIASIFDVAVEHNLFKMNRRVYYYKDKPLIDLQTKGRDKTINSLRNMPDLVRQINSELLKLLSPA